MMEDFFIALFLATLITALFSTRLYRLIWWYSLNSLMLGLLAIYIGDKISDRAMIVSGVITLILKSLLIPYFLKFLSQSFI